MITLKKNKIKKQLNNYPYAINVVRKSSSTNDKIKGMKDFSVLATTFQTKGKGTRGRTFFSPKGKGVYFSIILKDEKYYDKKITPLCAVAVVEALSALSDERFAVKWVNDVFLSGKKVCGILAEKGEYGLVVGVGVNLERPKKGYGEFESVATAVFDKAKKGTGEKFFTLFLKRFYAYINGEDFYEKYVKYCFVIGKSVKLSNGKSAVAKEINEDFSLTVVYEDGKEEKLTSGEIGIKLN